MVIEYFYKIQNVWHIVETIKNKNVQYHIFSSRKIKNNLVGKFLLVVDYGVNFCVYLYDRNCYLKKI